MTTQPMDFPAFVGRCVYLDGVHVITDVDCPHGRESDEQGEIKPDGWTVQSRSR